MSGNHNSTINHNKEVLTKDLGLTQYRNSTIFVNKDYFVLSPSVQNKNNWFDLRKVNLDKKPAYKKGFLIIRLLNAFILDHLDRIILELCDDNPYETKNSGINWKFQIRTNELNKQYIFNTKSKEKLFVELIDKNELISKIK